MLLPVLPLAPASHHLYMVGIPAAVMQGTFLVGLGRLIRKRFALLGRAEPHLTRAAVAVLLMAMVGASVLYGWCFLAGTAPEHQVVGDVLTLAESPASGDEIFFINLPLTAFWVSPAIETASGLQRLRAYVLTLADRPFIQTGRTVWDEQTRIEPLPGAPLAPSGLEDVRQAAGNHLLGNGLFEHFVLERRAR